MTQHHDDDQPITFDAIRKWIPLFGATCSIIITVVWHAAAIRSEVQQLKALIESNRAEMEQRLKTDEVQIERNRTHEESTDQNVADLNRKLDVTITILGRIDKKVGSQ
jgi:predicted Holliday junction resolvase-like endonuclease